MKHGKIEGAVGWKINLDFRVRHIWVITSLKISRRKLWVEIVHSGDVGRKVEKLENLHELFAHDRPPQNTVVRLEGLSVISGMKTQTNWL